MLVNINNTHEYHYAINRLGVLLLIGHTEAHEEEYDHLCGLVNKYDDEHYPLKKSSIFGTIGEKQ